MTQLEGRYADPSTDEIMHTASFTDPRFKLKYIVAGKVSSIKARVKAEMMSVTLQEEHRVP